MQKTLPLWGLLLLFSCSPQDTINPIAAVTDNEITDTITASENSDTTGNATTNHRNKNTILRYFDSLIDNDQIIVGQHCGDGADATASYYNRYIDMLADETGRHVGLMGADFGFFPSTNYPVQSLIDHWNEGGLVTVSWHTDNPFVAGYDAYWNTVENKDKINLRALLKDADPNAAKTSYRNELDAVAGALQKLRDAGVTVIWRPFHEMNGDFFWWGINAYNNQQTNEAAYIALWRDLYHTLTYDYGLNNLLWTYSVIPYTQWNADVTAFYPGDRYVDIVGMDYYGVSPDFPDYNTLLTLGKTIVMSEAGPKDEGYGNWNEMQLARMLKGKAAYFLQWHSWRDAEVAIKDNKKVMDMMNSKTVITRDEIQFGSSIQ